MMNKTNTYKTTQQLFSIQIKLHKKYSALFYFYLEAQDNLCFFSTLEHENGQIFRQVVIKGSIEFKDEFKRFLNFIKDEMEIEIEHDQIILDSAI